MSSIMVVPVERIQYNAKQFSQHTNKGVNHSNKNNSKFPDKSIFEVTLECASLLEIDKHKLNTFRKAVFEAL